jgi:hypothetical protein
MALPAYPAMLTDKDWQKHKGVIAKMAGETGIGAQMDKTETAWKKIAWAKFDAAKIWADMNPKKVEDYDKKLEEAKKEHAKLDPVKKELWALRDLATKVTEGWKANKLIPKSSREHVEKIASTADSLALQLKDILGEFATVKAAGSIDKPTLEKKLGDVAGKVAADLDKRTQQEWTVGTDKNWFGRDFLRFLDGYKIVKDGKTIVERFSKVDSKTALKKLVEAMGSTWAVPDDQKMYDVSSASGGPLEKNVGQTLKADDPLYRVMSLMSQKGMTDVAKNIRDQAGVVPALRFASKQAIADRWQDTDKWSVDVEVTDKTVRVVHRPCLLEGEGSFTRFKVFPAIPRVLDRATKKVTCEKITYDVKMNQ